MDRCDRYLNRRQRGNPSFSSSLLDEIFRSIDEGGGERDGGGEKVLGYRETMRKKRGSNCSAQKVGGDAGFECEQRLAILRQACRLEEWMEKKAMCEKAALRRNFDRKLNSSSSSSESSSGCLFSSPEAETGHGVPARPSGFASHRPKPIRTSFPAQHEKFEHVKEMECPFSCDQKPKHQNNFSKTKSKALKIYGDLKKVKQPISPGGRLASFLNSLFTGGTPKKAKFSPRSARESFDEAISRDIPNSKSSCASTCSSASSYSRSCLSNPLSREKSTNGAKRSVRFCPVSVILGEEDGPRYQNKMKNPTNNELEVHAMERNLRVEEAARDLLKSYCEVERAYYTRDARVHDGRNFDNNNDDDDAASYASSDLFELDHLSAIEELPVYETTHLGTNLAIANGLI